AYNMTPDEYRTKWSLPPDYPMVAPHYAEQRSEFAKRIGLGRGTGRAGARRPATGAAAKK
ncbi:MAG: MucR family transcriptional regulator, partial [Stellaceae bacterium]